MFKETHPIIGTRDVQRAITFYTEQLGFKLALNAQHAVVAHVAIPP